MAIELYCNQSINGTLTTTGTGTFGGDVVVGGTTGSTGNAFSVNRGSDGAQALRVQNSGEVVTSANYLYAASSGTSLYVQNTAVFRGSIINDSGDVTINDTLRVNDDTTFQNSNVTINGTTSNTVPALKVTESGDNLFEVGPTNTITFRLGDVDGLGDETFIEGSYSDIKFKGNGNTTAIFDGNNRVTINSSTTGAYQLGVAGSIGTTSSIAWVSSGLSGSPSYTAGINSSNYLEIDEVSSGGTLKIDTDNTRIGSGQVYLEGGLTSATPSQYLGRVTGGGGGVMVGRTAAQVLADIGAAPASGGAYLPLSGGTLTGDLYIPQYLYHAGDTNTYLRFQSDSIELYTGGWKVFGNTTLKYGALYGDNSLRVYATQAGGYINGTLTVDTINNATSDTDKFLVSDGDEIKYRTGAEVLADIGAGTGTVTGTGSNGQIAIFSGSSSLTSNSSFKEISTGVIYSERQFQVKGINAADFTSAGDTDTGLGSFDGANGVSLVSKSAKQITVKEGSVKFDPYTATAVATTASLNANQNNQAPTQDTLAQLCVDPDGNVVRGEQEGTWTFTRAQLNGTLGNTLISAPGTNKAIIVTESDWMVKYSAVGAVSGNQSYDIRQANNVQSNANISTLPGARINEIMNAAQGTPTNPSYGFCTRDVPLQTRTYKTNVATTLHKKSGDQLPAGLISISIKLKYRIFNATTF